MKTRKTTIQQIKEGAVTKANFSPMALTLNFANNLAQALESNTTVDSLNISMSNLNDEMFAPIARALLKRPIPLVELNIELSNLSSSESIDALINLIMNRKVGTLFIYKNDNIDYQDMKKIRDVAHEHEVTINTQNPIERLNPNTYARLLAQPKPTNYDELLAASKFLSEDSEDEMMLEQCKKNESESKPTSEINHYGLFRRKRANSDSESGKEILTEKKIKESEKISKDEMPNPQIKKIISGAQTGVDRAALDAARKLQLPYSGWIPKGRWAEDGRISNEYLNMKETPSSQAGQRTEWNARDSDGTLIILCGTAEGGTLNTIEMAQKYKKPYFVLDILKNQEVDAIIEWIIKNNIRELNFAGPRESKIKGIYEIAFNIIYKLLNRTLINISEMNSDPSDDKQSAIQFNTMLAITINEDEVKHYPHTPNVPVNYWVKYFVIDVPNKTLDFYCRDISTFNMLSKKIDDYEFISQTDEVEPETFELEEDVNILRVRFVGDLVEALNFVKNYSAISDVSYNKAILHFKEIKAYTEVKVEKPSNDDHSQEPNTIQKNGKPLGAEQKENDCISKTTEPKVSSRELLKYPSALFSYNREITPTSQDVASEKTCKPG
jgi:hypothetical protein